MSKKKITHTKVYSFALKAAKKYAKKTDKAVYEFVSDSIIEKIENCEIKNQEQKWNINLSQT